MRKPVTIMLLALTMISLCGILSSCTYFSQFSNQKKAAALRIGMTKKEVLAVMGPPLRGEVFNRPDVWWYYIDTKWHEGYTTMDECMPLIFKKGKLVGWGNKYYNHRYFSGKAVK